MKNVSDIDLFVGRRLREVRETKGLSLSALAKEVGVSPQQIQKYECWIDRISVGRLYEIAQALDVPVQDFFPDPEHNAKGRKQSLSLEREFLRLLSDPLLQRILRAVMKIRTDERKKTLLALVEKASARARI